MGASGGCKACQGQEHQGARCCQIDENVRRVIINHRSLRHPNIIGFKEVCLALTHLEIVMEYAAGGELFQRICSACRFSEDKTRFFFQQLISGVSYCHSMEICHRDLKLQNTLLDGSPIPRVKICDLGYSKSGLRHSQPKSKVGTPAYIAPEIISRQEYDGKIADVWSCGVTLYVMLVGTYPFKDTDDQNCQKIVSVQYEIPRYICLSRQCRHLLSLIIVANPSKRVTIPEIKRHPWFRKHFPRDLEKTNYITACDQPAQTVEEVIRILQEVKTYSDHSAEAGEHILAGICDIKEEEEEDDDDFLDFEVDTNGEYISITRN